MRIYKCAALSLVLFVFVLPVSVKAAVTVEFLAGTPAGWDFHALATDIARNNTVDLNDLNVIAQHWLNSRLRGRESVVRRSGYRRQQ